MPSSCGDRSTSVCGGAHRTCSVFAKVEMHAESELLALEKYGLVERLVGAHELGQFLEE